MEPFTSKSDIEAVDISIPKQASAEVKFEPGTNFSQQRLIQKVPAFFRQVEHNKLDYDPAAVSFGPYHHGKPELKFVEDFKPTALELFAAGTGKGVDFFYKRVLEVIDKVRSCYVKNSTDEYDDAVFARMMLLDACLIINLSQIMNMDMAVGSTIMGHLGMLVYSVIFRDLILLENQIPFWFLKLLIYLKFGKDEGEEKLRSFLISCLNDGEYEQTGESIEEEEPLHLLEACRRILVAHSSKDIETNCCYISEWISRQSAKIREACHRHCTLIFPWHGKRERVNPRLGIKKYIHSFRSVTDLKAKGIHFMSSSTDSFKDIKFKSSPFYVKLQLPTWIVTKNTKVFFLNMVAFEMCPNTYTDLAVSSYINFMKSLMESPQDVKELREKRIVLNMLGSDEEVLNVYKDINTFGVDHLEMFKKVREEIQDHYNSQAKTWVAEFANAYFRSPWSLIALLAAIFLLCLTLVQTYFTIRPPSNK